MSTARQVLHSYEDYLRIEQGSAVRHEYVGGEVYAMAGGTPEHSALAASALLLLSRALHGCTPLTSDLRIHVKASGLTTYPDVSFVCGHVERAVIDRLAICNPTVLVEVTSPSTESYDRGEKLRQYQRIETLQAVILVSHRQQLITVVERDDSGWNVAEFGSGTSAELKLHNARVSVDELYAVLKQL